MGDLTRLPLDDGGWRDFVEAHGDATPFHEPAWASLLAEAYDLSGFVLAAIDGSGSIAAGLPVLQPPRLPGRPRRLVSLPFTDFVPPLVSAQDEQEFASSLDAARRELGFARVELRSELQGTRPVLPQAVIHELALSADADAVLRGMTKGKRRDVRAAQRTPLTVRRAESERDIVDLYFGLHVATRRRLGVPSQPKRFFRLLWQRVLQAGLGFGLLAEDASTPVAGAIFLRANGTVVYKYGASDVARRAQLPTDLLLWTAIEEACERGDSSFDFGRTDLHAAGLRSFKARWGATERPLVYSAIGEGGSVAVAGASAIVGRVLRHSPLWVTRATGELLYRYAT